MTKSKVSDSNGFADVHLDSYYRTCVLERKLLEPVILSGRAAQLRRSMPIEAARGKEEDRKHFSHLEAVGRLLCGIAPHLESQHTACDSAQDFSRISVSDVRLLLDSISDPASPDFLNFSEGSQPLVDAAFLAQAFLRAPQALWLGLDRRVQENLLRAFAATRLIRPHFNNWLLFSATIEAFMFQAGESWDKMRVDYALRQHEQWYLGDGVYGDGPEFRWDYYNSFVIQPMMIDVLNALKGQYADWDRLYGKVLLRAQRYAIVLERLIGPDGSFPPIGRSLAYRCGAFHLLAQLAWLKLLPAGLPPAQVRCALMAVIEKTLGSESNYDGQGWLRIGLGGHQPSIGEDYVSTGSLYLCSTAFLPLGLPMTDPFWSDPDMPWTQRRVWWLTDDISPDKAL